MLFVVGFVDILRFEGLFREAVALEKAHQQLHLTSSSTRMFLVFNFEWVEGTGVT